jgi:putative hemolysin
VIATYRLLPPHRNNLVPRAGGLYAAREFDLTPLERVLRTTVEAGRACVHPDHRDGTAISLLWGGIHKYMRSTGNRHLLGCGSVSLRADGHATAAEFWRAASNLHMAPKSRRCVPLAPLTLGPVSTLDRPKLPPLLKAYLLLGAVVCGPPAFDEVFNTADFLLLLDLHKADPRYLRRTGG